jgi:hypothetical protein
VRNLRHFIRQPDLLTTAVGLSEDLHRGVVDRFRSMPIARSAVLAGHNVADLARDHHCR